MAVDQEVVDRVNAQSAEKNQPPEQKAAPLNLGTVSFNRAPEFTTSQQIGKIAAALASAQAEIVQPTKDADNTFFKSKYATLDVLWEAARHALSKHGIAVVQAPSYEVIDLGDAQKPKKVGLVTLTTMLVHSSGEWFRNIHRAVAEQIGPQGAQSALTYARRAALGALCMVTPQDEDDDAEAATDRSRKGSGATERAAGDSIEEWTKALKTAKSNDELAKAWEAIPAEFKPQFVKLKDARKKAIAALAADTATPESVGASD